MAHSYHHAVSSARKWGGTPDAYQSIHDWMDGSKLILADLWRDNLGEKMRQSG